MRRGARVAWDFRAFGEEAPVKGFTRIVIANFLFELRNDRAVVELLVHPDDGHSCFFFSMKYGHFTWSGAAELGEKGGMEVEATVLGIVEEYFWNKLGIVCDNGNIQLWKV